jgi:glycosyltransferase involved in cell wall biosynthesis
VHTFHGFPFHEFQSAARRRGYVAIERRLGRITDLALCVGTGVAVEAVRRELVAPQRIRTIGVVVKGAGVAAGGDAARPRCGPGKPCLQCRSCRSRARRRARVALGLPADAAVVGAVGRLTYQKAPADFLAALVALRRPGVIGVWIGGGELADRIGHLARATPEVRVVLTGERTDIMDMLPAFDVFALPSRYEGLPTAVVEATVCGIPVVATAVNAVSDVAVPGETGLLVPPHRPDLMAAAVCHLLDSPAVAAQLAAAARARIGPRYGAPALRDALTAAYAPPAPARRGEQARRTVR